MVRFCRQVPTLGRSLTLKQQLQRAESGTWTNSVRSCQVEWSNVGRSESGTSIAMFACSLRYSLPKSQDEEGRLEEEEDEKEKAEEEEEKEEARRPP